MSGLLRHPSLQWMTRGSPLSPRRILRTDVDPTYPNTVAGPSPTYFTYLPSSTLHHSLPVSLRLYVHVSPSVCVYLPVSLPHSPTLSLSSFTSVSRSRPSSRTSLSFSVLLCLSCPVLCLSLSPVCPFFLPPSLSPRFFCLPFYKDFLVLSVSDSVFVSSLLLFSLLLFSFSFFTLFYYLRFHVLSLKPPSLLLYLFMFVLTPLRTLGSSGRPPSLFRLFRDGREPLCSHRLILRTRTRDTSCRRTGNA